MQPNLNYQQDLLSEELQRHHLPQLAELLNNVWFKHLIATWQQEVDIAVNAVCRLPVNSVGTAILLLQQRDVLAVYRDCVSKPYETYNQLVEQKENKDGNDDTRTDDTGTD
jgi:hypothetical protein